MALLGGDWPSQRRGADMRDPFAYRIRLRRSWVATGGITSGLLRSVDPVAAARAVRRFRPGGILVAAE